MLKQYQQRNSNGMKRVGQNYQVLCLLICSVEAKKKNSRKKKREREREKPKLTTGEYHFCVGIYARGSSAWVTISVGAGK